MFRELLSSLTMSCGAAARQLGLMDAAVRLDARHHRCGRAWAPHLARCREFIGRAATDCPGRDLAVVVGSGHLLDIPLDLLAAAFRRVVLADVAHPRVARRAAARLPNVTLLEFDATGLHQEVMRICRNRVCAALPVPAPPELPGPRPDLLVSANLLSQLPLRPVESLRRDLLEVAEQDLAALARGVIDAHLEWLGRAADRVCLVSDFLRVVRGDAGEQERMDLLRGATLPPGETWEWLLAPRPEALPHADVVHLVRGVADLGRAIRAGHAERPAPDAD